MRTTTTTPSPSSLSTRPDCPIPRMFVHRGCHPAGLAATATDLALGNAKTVAADEKARTAFDGTAARDTLTASPGEAAIVGRRLCGVNNDRKSGLTALAKGGRIMKLPT